MIMNPNLENNLNTMTLPTIEVEKHQQKLRRALLTSSHWDKKSSFLSEVIVFLKGGDKHMINKLALSGLFIAVLALGIFALARLQAGNSTAYAKELAQKSIQAVSNLTPEQLQTLKQRLPNDPNEILDEAKNAKDLQTLTYDQFVGSYPQVQMSTNGGFMGITGKGPLPVPSDALQSDTMDMRSFKFLQFTNKNGDKVVVGIDQNNLPTFAMGSGKDGNWGFVKKPGIEGTIPSDKAEMNLSTMAGKTITVGGKKYAVPSAADNDHSTVKVINGEVYINGEKAKPVE
jgi:hypothetical protein